MNVKGINGMTIPQIQDEVACGAKFVQFPFCISLIVVSFRFSSAVYLVKNEESSFVKALPFMMISLLFGWWGIPFGPFYTFSSLVTTVGGGKDITEQMMATLHRHTRGYVFDFEKSDVLTSAN